MHQALLMSCLLLKHRPETDRYPELFQLDEVTDVLNNFDSV